MLALVFQTIQLVVTWYFSLCRFSWVFCAAVDFLLLYNSFFFVSSCFSLFESFSREVGPSRAFLTFRFYLTCFVVYLTTDLFYFMPGDGSPGFFLSWSRTLRSFHFNSRPIEWILVEHHCGYVTFQLACWTELPCGKPTKEISVWYNKHSLYMINKLYKVRRDS